MKIIKINNESANIQISLRELTVLNNTIIEAFNGISLAEFKTRTGFYREEVEQVRQLLLSLLRNNQVEQETIQL